MLQECCVCRGQFLHGGHVLEFFAAAIITKQLCYHPFFKIRRGGQQLNQPWPCTVSVAIDSSDIVPSSVDTSENQYKVLVATQLLVHGPQHLLSQFSIVVAFQAAPLQCISDEPLVRLHTTCTSLHHWPRGGTSSICVMSFRCCMPPSTRRGPRFKQIITSSLLVCSLVMAGRPPCMR